MQTGRMLSYISNTKINCEKCSKSLKTLLIHRLIQKTKVISAPKAHLALTQQYLNQKKNGIILKSQLLLLC